MLRYSFTRNASLTTVYRDIVKKRTTVVKLAYTRLSVKELRSILRAILNNGNITFLDLSNCAINDEGAALLAWFLKQNTTVRFLKLENNDITTKGLQLIANALIDPDEFERNKRLQQIIHPEVAQLTLSPNVSLQHLRLGGNQLDDSCVETLRCLALGNISLKSLSTDTNQLSRDAQQAIDETYAYNPSMRF